MADEKNLNNEELNEEVSAVEETVTEEVAEAAAEAAAAIEEVEAAEEMSDIDRAVAEAMAQRDMQEKEERAKKSRKVKAIAIVTAVVVVIAGAVASGFVDKGADGGIKFNSYGGWLPKLVNKYNHMGYIDVTGRNVGDVAESLGVEVADFLEMYSLPADMGASTSEMSALYNMPAKSYAEMYGLDFATIKELMKIPETTEDGETITEDTPWGIVEGEIAVGDYTQGNVDMLKEQYGLGDDITAETKWKHVRPVIDEKARQERIASEKAAEEDVVTDDTVTEDVVAEDTATTETATEEAPAETATETTAE